MVFTVLNVMNFALINVKITFVFRMVTAHHVSLYSGERHARKNVEKDVMKNAILKQEIVNVK